MDELHIPVLLNECLEGLDIKPDGIYIDGTAGRGGHSSRIAERLEGGLLISIDQDSEAVAYTTKRLEKFGARARVVKGNFRDLGSILAANGVDKADGMLFDLGVSSPQLDDPGRGFSYMNDAPLDMRMDREQGRSAWDLVNGESADELARILFTYGEERYARRIASAIVSARQKKPIETTLELAQIIRSAMPAQALREKQHPAKRSFQALRIAVNDELGALADMLEQAMDHLKPGGRLAVISFHSLEDRLVKNAIRARENGCTCPPGLPVCACGFVRTMRSVSSKPIVATKEEMELNPRSRSAKLRVAERI